jgi:osmotically-inducible protein OsmY
MRIVLKRPTKARAKTFADAFAAVGGTIGSLPVTIRPGSRGRTRPKPSAVAAKIGAPVAAVLALGAMLKSRRGRATVHRATHPQSAQTPIENDDVTLARKVETEIFRSADVPKGDIVVNAEFGVVSIRGQVPDAELAGRLVAEARRIPGVKDVKNLLHAPSEPAPTAEPSAPEDVKERAGRSNGGAG